MRIESVKHPFGLVADPLGGVRASAHADSIICALQSALDSQVLQNGGQRFYDHATSEQIAEVTKAAYDAWLGDDGWRGGSRTSFWLCLWETRGNTAYQGLLEAIVAGTMASASSKSS